MHIPTLVCCPICALSCSHIILFQPTVASPCVCCNLMWLGAGYIRGGDAAFMGLDRKTSWRGGHRLLRELGHGLYLMWILLNFVFVWAVGVSRFTDNKHHISDIVGGWMLGFTLAVIYATRSTCLHKYVVMHNLHEINQQADIAAQGMCAFQGIPLRCTFR